MGEQELEESALGYAARYATTRARLEAYLARKVRERGWKGEGEPPISQIAAKMVEHGYVDDRAFAQARSGSLLRRGYGAGRVSQALYHAGVDNAVAEEIRPGEAEQRLAGLALARKRRFGPFGGDNPDPAQREKQLAAMQRAGHPLQVALAIIDAHSAKEAERWAAEALELE